VAVGDTIGVEEEFHLVDPVTGALVAASADVRAHDPEVLEAELMSSCVETGTPVCTDLSGLRAALLERRARLLAAAHAQGLAVVAAGTVPDSGDPGIAVTAGDERYARMQHDYAVVTAEQQVCAMQVQVGVPDRDLAVRLLRRVRLWLPTLLALSSSSPAYRLRDSGYASWRTMQWTRWPSAGPPGAYASGAEYDATVDTLVEAGVLSDRGMVYFDARPSARYPTLEIRIMDSCPLVEDVVLLPALGRGLVEVCAADEAAGVAVPPLRDELLRAATWRAARSGLDDRLLDPWTMTSRPAWEVVAALRARVLPAVEARGDAAEVDGLLAALRARGTSARRQRALGDWAGVPALLSEETARGVSR